ncbi:MAG: extracellular solute-binding protein [Chloroflexi bacterium]|nr:extracellular solute-binding protein [Chloroflexota bacterium]
MSKLRSLAVVVLILGLLVGCATPTGEPTVPPGETPPGVETPGAVPTEPEAVPTEPEAVPTEPEAEPEATMPAEETPTVEEEDEGTPTVEAEGTPTTEAEGTPTTEAEGTPTTEADETPEAGAPGELLTPEEAAMEAAGGEEIGGSVSFVATWTGVEQEALDAMLAPFIEATGISIDYTGTRDLDAILTTRVAGNNPPDLAAVANPGIMAQFGREGELVDLSTVLDMDTFGEQYAEVWQELGSVDGTLNGLFMKAASKGFIWYNVGAFEDAGYEIPETWDDLMAISQEIADTGTAPWSEALESGAASGWPGTDWIEDILLRQSGQEAYDAWWMGELAWTSDEVRQAFETWGEIVATDGMVYGGVDTVLTTNFEGVGDPLFADPPQAYLAHQGSFIADFIVSRNPDVEPITDLNFFGFPVFNEGDPQAVIGGGDAIIMFNDTPQAQALVRYLASPEAQAIWAEAGGGYISANQAMPLDVYPDEITAGTAEILLESEVVVFDASDLMPSQVNQAFFSAILEYVQNPAQLDAILENMDAVAADAYAQ